ncbi:helix-turn-helix domain-containing protein [Cellulomonas olei]|uniref:helix-turn-helix domain-containing protein n=1 Tax=Cellulomonas sp. P4 TaxID=3142533 RepID=UPI0031BBA776
MTAPTCTRKPGALTSRCRCVSCRARHAKLTKANRAGLYPRAPREQAWDALGEVLRRGWTDLAIASASGLPRDTVHAILVRHRAGAGPGRIAHVTAHALAELRDPTAGRVGSLSTVRRLRALSRVGWEMRALSAVTGVPLMTLHHVRAGQNATALTSVWAAVRTAYRDLADVPGPSTRALERATALGWEPPAAWDEDSIEDPAEPAPVAVDEVAVERAVAGRPVTLTRTERDLAVPRMVDAGMSDSQIADLLGLCTETVYRTRRRLAVPAATARRPEARAS